MKTRLRRVARRVAYPGTVIGSVWLFYRLERLGVGAGLSSYLVATFGGLVLITGLEYLLPYRMAWRPKCSEIHVDLVFIALVQVLLPKALILLATVTLLHWVGAEGVAITGLWPHALPAWTQMSLMMLIGDFFHYWLHRAAHELRPLWKFHAVHHSVNKMYWLNVGRFHPVDKSLQFLCDGLPFILLGVSEQVMALYFVVYSIKGFFQHSNVDVRLGLFNYLISGPELHRWHHSRSVAESNRNYGNNLIIWDIVFGTYFLPKQRSVGALGLRHDYPGGFLGQLKAPFIDAEVSHETA